MEQSEKTAKPYRDNGGEAFPGGVNSVYTNMDQGMPTQPGMTLRQWYAGKALAILAHKLVIRMEAHSGGCTAEQIEQSTGEAYAKAAFTLADAMIAEGNK